MPYGSQENTINVLKAVLEFSGKCEDIFLSAEGDVLEEEAVFKNFAKLPGKHLWSLFYNIVAALKLRHKYFPANFTKFLRCLFFLLTFLMFIY